MTLRGVVGALIARLRVKHESMERDVFIFGSCSRPEV
jgi:hypothetical protein